METVIIHKCTGYQLIKIKMQYNQTKYLPNRLTNEPTSLPTNHIISASGVIVEKLTVPQRSKENPIYYGT